jgi:hypothetical protein
MGCGTDYKPVISTHATHSFAAFRAFDSALDLSFHAALRAAVKQTISKRQTIKTHQTGGLATEHCPSVVGKLRLAPLPS